MAGLLNSADFSYSYSRSYNSSSCSISKEIHKKSFYHFLQKNVIFCKYSSNFLVTFFRPQPTIWNKKPGYSTTNTAKTTSLFYKRRIFLVNQLRYFKILMGKIQCVLSHYFTSFHEKIYTGTNTCAPRLKLLHLEVKFYF